MCGAIASIWRCCVWIGAWVDPTGAPHAVWLLLEQRENRAEGLGEACIWQIAALGHFIRPPTDDLILCLLGRGCAIT